MDTECMDIETIASLTVERDQLRRSARYSLSLIERFHMDAGGVSTSDTLSVIECLRAALGGGK